MSETVTVIEAKNPNPWEHGITYYDMIFDRNGQRFGCSWGTKGGEPQVGEEVTGEFSQKDDGSWKFTKGSKDKPSGGNSRPSESSTGTRSSSGETNWTERNAEIRRQHSQQVAIEALALAKFAPTTFEMLKSEIDSWADYFDADAIAAGQKASQGAGAGTEGGGSPTSSSVHSKAAPPPEQSPADAHEWLENLLIQGGASTYGAGKLASFATEELSPENLKKCEALLSNLDSQVDGRERLEASYTKAKGEPVPQEDPDEEPLPF